MADTTGPTPRAPRREPADRLRLCHVSPHLPPDQAANALLPSQLGRWMAVRGDEVRFVAHPRAGEAPARSEADDLHPLGPGPWALEPETPIRWIPRRAGTRFQRLLKLDAWRLVRQVRTALDDVAADADLLHLHSNGLIIEAAAAWAQRRQKPYVLTLYGTDIWHYKRRWPVDPFTRAYFGATRVTFYSQRLLIRARGEGLDRNGMTVVYPPVAEMFAPREAATRQAWRRALGIAEPLLLLSVKRLHPLAGQRYLIDAFAEICRTRQNVRLVICGEGPLHDDLTRQVASLGIAGRVTLAGLVPNERIAQYMAAADVFVLPSLLEALPTVAVEALASGTPVVSADHPGGLELHGIFGADVTVVPRESVEPLARALLEFVDRPRRTLAATANRLSDLFRPAAVLKAYDAVYADCLSAASRPTPARPQPARPARG